MLVTIFGTFVIYHQNFPPMHEATVPSDRILSFFIMFQAMAFDGPQLVHPQCPKHTITMSQTCDFTADHIVPCAKQRGYLLNVPHNGPHVSPACSCLSHLVRFLNVLSGWYAF